MIACILGTGLLTEFLGDTVPLFEAFLRECLFIYWKGELQMTNEEKYRQIRREAGFTGLALLLLILFWLLAGFGAAQLDIRVFHLPLWAVTSSIGVWAVAILLAWFLSMHVFRDMSLQDEDGEVKERG